MGTKKWILLGITIVILAGAILLYNNTKDINFENREDVLEFKDIKNYTVYIKEINAEESEIRLYNKETKLDESIEDFKGNFYDLKISPDESFFIVDEGYGVVKTTYIVDLEDIKNIKKLVNIGDVIISPDSKKLLIGVENLKSPGVETELNGTIDLVIYYVNTGSIETLIEADKYTNYEGISWGNEDNIRYKKITGDKVEELSIKYEASAEETIMELIYSKENPDISKVLSYIPNIDFDKLEDLYGENTTIELLEWLEEQEISKKEDILILINSMDNFFGKEYFTYIRGLSNSYIDFKFEFIKALAQAPERLEDIGYALNYMGVYNLEGQNMWKDLDKIANSKELSEEERQIGMDLIYFYSQCST